MKLSHNFSVKKISFLIILLLIVSGCGQNRFKKYQTKDDTDYTISNTDSSSTDTVNSDDSSNSSYPKSNAYKPTYTKSISSFETSMARREAEEFVGKAYKIDEFKEGVECLRNNDPLKASKLIKKALSKSASNGFIKAKLRHADLMVNRNKALNNRALIEALKISHDYSRKNETLSLASEALRSDPKNPIIKKQANKIIYDLSKKTNRGQALEAKYKMIDAKKLIQGIIKKSSSYTINYRKK